MSAQPCPNWSCSAVTTRLMTSPQFPLSRWRNKRIEGYQKVVSPSKSHRQSGIWGSRTHVWIPRPAAIWATLVPVVITKSQLATIAAYSRKSSCSSESAMLRIPSCSGIILLLSVNWFNSECRAHRCRKTMLPGEASTILLNIWVGISLLFLCGSFRLPLQLMPTIGARRSERISFHLVLNLSVVWM